MEINGNKKKKKSSWMVTVGIVLLLVATMAFVLFLMNGQTTLMGEFEGKKISETLVCEQEGISYPIFNYDYADSRSLKINVVFESQKLSSISLIYKLDYSTEEAMRQSESLNHAAMNLSFYDDGLGADALNAKYSFLDNSLQMSIYAKRSDLSQKVLKYFMLGEIYDLNKMDEKKITEIYIDAGLDCVAKHKTKEEIKEDEK